MTLEAVRKLMNTFRVDGLTRALTRQLQIADFLSFSFGFISVSSFVYFFLMFSYHNSSPRVLTGTRIGGNGSYQPPGAP